MINVGDRVKDKTTDTFRQWVGEVRDVRGNLALVKWDPSYTLSEGMIHNIDTLEVVDPNTPIGKQE